MVFLALWFSLRVRRVLDEASLSDSIEDFDLGDVGETGYEGS